MLSNTHAVNAQTDTWVVKLNSSGNKIFEKCYGGTSQEYACGIINDNDGNYVLLSTSSSTDGDVTGHHGNSDTQDYWVTKINKLNGAIIWQKSLGGTEEEQAGTISLASNGDYVINGESYSNDGDITAANGYWDYWMVRLTPALTVPWNYSLGTERDEQGISIVEAAPGCYIVAGEGNGKFIADHGGFGFDYWVAKVCDSALNTEENDFGNSGITVYPNPMVSDGVLRFNRQLYNCKVEINDIYGQTIATLQYVSGNEMAIDKKRLPSGVYFLKITDTDKKVIAIKKIIVSD
ncbi:T9SS type A sorting domain-containing protein [Flavobacterium humi]|uniref:T9SS type A sorting domain-containing protein n=1 Tax=Flavobacterium humi TaxID=2562683 RepID=A0A4Z0L3K3_9FLAO|nr:T9SS type A sorting domain-containing protein [Flavobacterium humi]TGD56921.1 T9SS type A sorting domain-containing protein [Flavobacterium humi]